MKETGVYIAPSQVTYMFFHRRHMVFTMLNEIHAMTVYVY